MGYQTFKFFIFSAIVILVYFLVPKKFQKYVLLLSNTAFFLISGPKYIPFIIVTMCATFFTAKRIGKVWEKEKDLLSQCADNDAKKEVRANCKKEASRYLSLGLFIAIGLLAVCKYSNFVCDNLNALFALFSSFKIPTFKMILPLGISFYTFMAIGYTLDIYWKRYPYESNFLNYAVFLSYFPHVVQGPIDRYNKFYEQIKDGTSLTYKNLTYGLQLFLWGLFKKIVIADRLAMFVNETYSRYSYDSGLIFWMATIFYAVQMYADFSGCIDIVSGISEIMGIKLTKNFNHPFFARTIAEFWKRWHITLGAWFTDYVYMPLSTSQFIRKIKKHYREKNNPRMEHLAVTTIATITVWFTTGLWHGAAWKYVAWGIYYIVVMVIGNILEPYYKPTKEALHIKDDQFSWHAFQVIRTFILTLIGRIFFRADNLKSGLQIFGCMFNLSAMFTSTGIKHILSEEFFTYGMDWKNWIVVVVAMLIMWIVELLGEKEDVRDILAKENIWFRWMVFYALIFAIYIFGVYGPGYEASAFLYERF